MVVQPHPAGGRVARWHYVPGNAGVLPADVPPFSGGSIIYSLEAYPMRAGRTRIAPGKQAAKDGEDRKRQTLWLSGFRQAIGGFTLPLFPGWESRE